MKYYPEDSLDMELSDRTMYQIVWEKNKDHPDDIALIFFGNKITYGDFFHGIDITTNILTDLGVGSGDVVSIIAITTPEILYILYACSRIGAVANMLDPRMSSEILKRLIENADSKYLFILNTLGKIVNDLIEKCELKEIVEIDMKRSMSFLYKVGFQVKNGKNLTKVRGALSWDELSRKASRKSTPNSQFGSVKGDAPVLIEYTGGTTGFPKGVLLSNNNVNSIGEQYGVLPFYRNRGDLCQCIAAPFIAYTTIASTHMPLMTGKTCKITIYDPDKIAKDVIDNDYNHVYGNPGMWEKVIRSESAKDKDFSKLISPITGADVISIPQWEEINEFLEKHKCGNVLCNGYGMTELASAVCVNLTKDAWKIGSVGIPFLKTTVAIFDTETNKELSYDAIGEVCVKGPSVMIGYLNNKEATDDMIKIHDDGERWLHTGDLGHIDKDGFVFIDGRIKRMIIRTNGAKVFPGEIERIIMEDEDVLNCIVVGKKEQADTTGVMPVAFVVLNEGADKDTVFERVMSVCCKELQDYAVPASITAIDEIPRTPVGKADYRALELIANK